MDPTKIWTGEDVKANLESAVVERGMRMLIAQRLGQKNTLLKTSPHIEYNYLGREESSVYGDSIRGNCRIGSMKYDAL